MAEESWHAARLIPTSGINGAEEQERRATSALLAVMSSVKEFGRAVTQPLGAPAGPLEAFIEVPFELGERRVFPDGLIRVTRGKRSWVTLVEVKTGTNELRAEQVEDYLDVARGEEFDMVLTISNQIVPAPGVHPVSVDKRKLRKVTLAHLSWTQILTEAVMQKRHHGVADPDQAYILDELIRYLEHPRSGAMSFEDMSDSWVTVRNAVSAGTLRTNDKGAAEVASRWDQLIRFACLRLGKELGVEVHPVLKGKEKADYVVRSQALVSALAERGVLEGSLVIPDAAGEITLTADLRAQQVSASMDIAAPRDGRALTRVNWLVRQLKNAPARCRVDAFVAHGRSAAASELLEVVRESPAVLVVDPKRELRTFRVVLAAPMGAKRGDGRGSFIASQLGVLDEFYDTVGQHLKAWAASPPKLRNTAADIAEEIDAQTDEGNVSPADVSTAPSSQDGPEPVDIGTTAPDGPSWQPPPTPSSSTPW